MVQASIIVLLAQAALVTVAPGSEEDCPSSAQVQTALETHASRWVAPRPEDSPAGLLTLTLSPALGNAAMSLSLVDKAGLVKLYRTLPTPVDDRAHDCAALADTIAFIVDRYFEEVALPSLPERKIIPPPAPSPAPPPAPPPPPVSKEASSKPETAMFVLAVTAGRRMPGAAADLGGIEIKLNGGAALTTVGKHGGRLWLDFAAGIVGIANRGWNNNNYNNYYSGDATAIRSGGDLALLLGWPVWHGRLYAGPLASLDMVWLEANSNNRNQHEIHFGSAAGLRAGYQYLWRNHLFVRADVTGCAAIVRNLIVTQSAPNTPLFESPPAYLTLALGVGIWF